MSEYQALVDMGFPSATAKEAWQASGGNMELALELLTSDSLPGKHYHHCIDLFCFIFLRRTRNIFLADPKSSSEKACCCQTIREACGSG